MDDVPKKDVDIDAVAAELSDIKNRNDQLKESIQKIDELLELEKQRANGLQNFKIDKMYAAYFECTKLTNTSLITYIFLLAVTALLIFSKGIEGNITVPLLLITTSKNYAAAISLGLCCVVLFWHNATFFHSLLIEYLLKHELQKRYGTDDVNTSFFDYPSPLKSTYLTIIYFSHVLNDPGLFILLTVPLLLCFYFGLPLLLAWQLGNLIPSSASIIFLLTALAILPSMVTYVAQVMLHWRKNKTGESIKKTWEEAKAAWRKEENIEKTE